MKSVEALECDEVPASIVDELGYDEVTGNADEGFENDECAENVVEEFGYELAG